MKKNLIIIVLNIICIFPHAQSLINYKTAIGKTFVNIKEISIFKDYKEEMGTIISSLEKQNKGYHIISNGFNKKIILSKSIIQGNRVQYYEIIAILDIGVIKKNESIIVQKCRLNKKNDDLIIALINTINSQPYYTNIIKAWKLNPKNNTFNFLSTNGIDCLNEEFYN